MLVWWFVRFFAGRTVLALKRFSFFSRENSNQHSFLYCVFFQRFLKKICIIEFQPSLKYLRYYMKINMAFENKSSTHLALLSFVDKVIQAIEEGEYAVGVFLDFSKGFDTVDHGILLDKLDHYGIRGCALSWFESYLSCRTQYVTYDGSESNRQMIKYGVPQGSILGPLLFLIYINDLCTVWKNTIPVIFADDTNLFLVVLMPLVSRMGSIMTWLLLQNGLRQTNCH